MKCSNCGKNIANIDSRTPNLISLQNGAGKWPIGYSILPSFKVRIRTHIPNATEILSTIIVIIRDAFPFNIAHKTTATKAKMIVNKGKFLKNSISSPPCFCVLHDTLHLN